MNNKNYGEIMSTVKRPRAERVSVKSLSNFFEVNEEAIIALLNERSIKTHMRNGKTYFYMSNSAKEKLNGAFVLEICIEA